MSGTEYALGKEGIIEQLYPPAKRAIDVRTDEGKPKLKNYPDVIRHYTNNSLKADGIHDAEVRVTRDGGKYRIRIDSKKASQAQLDAFAKRHAAIMAPEAAGMAINGKNLMQELGVWNPMKGFHVNDSAADGKCKWHLFPPLGLNICGQKGVLLMHYPPWQVVQQGTFLECMTMSRWNTVLHAVGVPDDEVSFFRTIVDVNPIAAPGSGQSEYPNDYFPIMMASAFFDGPGGRDYIRTMLELYLNPPGHDNDEYTLPLLVCGSPLYDPQAPGWFRVAYKDTLPQNKYGEVLVDVLQAGEFRVRDDSKRKTRYMVGNHMIAAGVTGRCTNNEGEMPDIRRYEAEDLVAASFLYECAKDPALPAKEAKERACLRWFGNKQGTGAPYPPKEEDRAVICALAQMDLFFEAGPPPHPKYTYEEALERCRNAKNDLNPCGPPIGPQDGGCNCS